MKTILFIVTEDWYFVSHRLHMAATAVDSGYRVLLLSRVSKHQEEIESLGIEVLDWSINRGSRNAVNELRSIYQIIGVVRRFQPDLIHAVAIKPVLYTLVSRLFSRTRSLVLALGGLGFIFRSAKMSAKVLKPLLVSMLRILSYGDNIRFIVQNEDDQSILTELKITDQNKIELIRGTGVDVDKFCPNAVMRSKENMLVVLPARMLWDKGVGDFVRCAQLCEVNDTNAKFVLVGMQDKHNPECISSTQLKEWTDSGKVEWLGHQSNMEQIYQRADIVCLPSYHEGLPKALVEASSCGIPIVAYDIAGCREVVDHGRSGFLVPCRDEKALCNSLLKLLLNPDLRLQMGSSGREIVVEKFSQEKISQEMVHVWDKLTR